MYAQSLSIDDTKKMLCSNKWFLRRLEQDGKMFSVPKDLLGLKMVFQSNGNMYSYLPGSKESDATIWTWSITKSFLTIYKSSGKEVNKYRLEDFIGYKLYLTDNDEDDMPTFVFEQAEKIAEKLLKRNPRKPVLPSLIILMNRFLPRPTLNGGFYIPKEKNWVYKEGSRKKNFLQQQ
ncbi:MAG: hypothetical protein IPG38_09115 [Chitinophagaceae bacterium]|nr:hypothetical protein [Chitinophagaceae bacterium]